MSNFVEKFYKTKSPLNGEIVETSLEGHLEHEHGIKYYANCLDFVGYDTLELIHAQIHSAYFEGFADGRNINKNPNETNSVSLCISRIKKEYPFSSFEDDCSVVKNLP